ncbi:MAG: hypothetical protein AAF939_14780 [Planctomycetota bacterium]
MIKLINISLLKFSIVALAVVNFVEPSFAQENRVQGSEKSNGKRRIIRLVSPSKKVQPPSSDQGSLVLNQLELADRIRQTRFESSRREADQPVAETFAARASTPDPAPSNVVPMPLSYGLGRFNQPTNPPRNRGVNPTQQGTPAVAPDEFIYDGNDKGERVQVDQTWNVTGLGIEDTIGHFDTLDGKRIVAPSNRVAIYAPRFGSVRRVDGVFRTQLNLPTASFEENMPTVHARGEDAPNRVNQNLALNRMDGRRRASEFNERTRGVLADNVTHLFGFRNSFEAYEDLSIIRYGTYAKEESARLNVGLLSGTVWQDNLGLQAVVENVSPIIVRDLKGVEELVSIESEDGTAILRLLKVASKISARAGEFVDFTIRFDNMSRKKIGNVTIMDNLTTRLEYVADTAECSLKADFISKPNEADSLTLRWEITDPIPAGDGGIIRFRCRVR